MALVTVVGSFLASSPARAAEPRLLTGTIDGAEYRIEVPPAWNGTLLLWSHGLVAPGSNNPAVDAPPTAGNAEALLASNYALAGSAYRRTGWAVEEALQDQMALLDYFASTVGPPKRTIAWGQSMGGLLTAAIVEQHPDRFAGGLPLCGVGAGAIGLWNQHLDGAFVFKTLVAPESDLPLVGISDGAANEQLLKQLLDSAQATTEGRARIALAAAVDSIPGWFDPASAELAATDFAAREEQQFVWLRQGIPFSFAVGERRAELVRRAGGNPSWNTGVDYRQRVEASPDRDAVIALYEAAGLSLDNDLQTLEVAPRIIADPDAVAYLGRNVVFSGDLRVPVLTLHTTGDGLAPVPNEQAYSDTVRAAGKENLLRQVFVHRAGHCQFTAAERVTAIRALVRRIDSGRWDSLDQITLNGEAAALGPDLNALTGLTPPVAVPPAFIAFAPSAYPRPFDAHCLDLISAGADANPPDAASTSRCR